MDTIVNFAVVGFGHIGKRHAEVISANKNCKLIAICDIDKNHSSESYGVSVFDDLEQMLQNCAEIDVVCICSPSGLHAAQSLLALDYQKHIVCEKPMALRQSDCEAMIFKAAQVGRHIFGVMQNRYAPISVWLKKMIHEKRLGDIFLVQTNCFWNRDDKYYKADNQQHSWHGDKKLDGGTLFTQFSHFVDMLFWLFGDVTNIQSRLFNFAHQHSIQFEDSGFVLFDFLSGGSGTLQYSTAVWDKNLESSITIIGSKGSIKVAGQYMEKLEYCHVENYELEEIQTINIKNNHVFVIQNVVDVLNHKNVATTNAAEGMKVVEIIERIYQIRP